MLDSFIRFYEKGDTQTLANKLLHTAFWSQHNFKAYGNAQINEAMSNWLAMAGRCKTRVLSKLQTDSGELYVLELHSRNNKKGFLMTLDVHHNQKVIKSVNCIVDTQQLAESLGVSLNDISHHLPQPDPLIVPDYDHQNHLQDDHAIPSMLMPDQHRLASSLDAWWQIWSVGQLSQIEQSYDKAAVIRFPDKDSETDCDKLFNAFSGLRSQFKRPFCQLLRIVANEQQAVLFWYFEGDEKDTLQRERISFCSILDFEQNLIVKDALVTDLAAHFIRYPESRIAIECT